MRQSDDRGGMEMKVIGITGGVGAGKSEVLAYLAKRPACRIIMADRVAHELEEPGGVCHGRIVSLLGKEILAPDGSIDKAKMASRIFAEQGILRQVNEIIHPAVKEYITGVIAEEKKRGELSFLFLEAALLIEDGYERIVDEMWYIHTDEAVRRKRLKASRGYTDAKIDAIMQGQLSEDAFYRHCSVVIDNSKTLEHVYRQIDEKLGEA